MCVGGGDTPPTLALFLARRIEKERGREGERERERERDRVVGKERE